MSVMLENRVFSLESVGASSIPENQPQKYFVEMQHFGKIMLLSFWLPTFPAVQFPRKHTKKSPAKESRNTNSMFVAITLSVESEPKPFLTTGKTNG